MTCREYFCGCTVAVRGTRSIPGSCEACSFQEHPLLGLRVYVLLEAPTEVA